MIFVAAPVALFFGGCSFGNLGGPPCQQIVQTADNSQGTFSFMESNMSPGSGTLPGSNGGLTVQASGPSTLAVSGDFVDQAGDCHSFSLSLTLGSSTGSMQLGSGSSACIDELPCSSLTGTLDLSTFSTNCMEQDDCALTIVGNLTTTTAWKGGSFGVNFSLNHADSWESYACNNGQGGE
jgi:hypothetical protein